MKCQFCENEANVFYTQVVDGKSKKMSLCDACADEQGITSLEEFQLADDLIKMSEEASEMNIETTEHGDKQCSECGFSLDNFRKVGRLGCSHCYTVFSSDIKKLLKKMHRDTKHKGKTPKGMLEVINAKRKLKDLQNALETAVKNENFEEAAKLHKALEKLKKSNKKGGVKS